MLSFKQAASNDATFTEVLSNFATQTVLWQLHRQQIISVVYVL